MLKEPCTIVPTSIVTRETKAPSYLAKNPNGQVPLLELESENEKGGTFLAESNAILLYLAETNQNFLLPSANKENYHLLRGLIYQWLFFEQYSHEPAIAVRRANLLFHRPCSPEKMKELLERGYRALDVMEEHFVRNKGDSDYLVGNEFTIADMALFAYTHVAQKEGGYEDMPSRCPNVCAWIERIKNREDFVEMTKVLEQTELPLVA
eukprot:CAMPEP_0202444090 /NCGR_PEP_ID=MMETSP1360-20130828/3240_1 /ASSEMBLY_ACC=CAM_ASM_000848 /TAXON_ID=515479 /ORGANISM="Licmophora paradoxa, Strain CCMP2313" /LENGTH=207 /DNA_ID=CAMNT_0049059983 /DNA_START=38 /DNA_END=661 /DNA_ORIENTATION=-